MRKFQRRTAQKAGEAPCYIGCLRRSAFKLVSRGDLAWLECSRLARLPWLVHAFSTRRGGVSPPPAAGLNLGMIASDLRANVEQNRKTLFRDLKAEGFSLASLRQVHSSSVFQAARGSRGEIVYSPPGNPSLGDSTSHPPQGDALLTDQAGMLLSVRTADCMPILLVNPRRHAIAAVHAGWRGALRGVLEKAVEEMRGAFGSDPKEMLAAIGPCIRACCYEVGEEVVATFNERFPNTKKFFRRKTRATKAHLDLVAVARRQLQAAGLRPSSILAAPFCTACRTDLFFSHRKEGSGTGRMMAVMGIRPHA